MRSVKEWQRAAYELACEKGWHSRECPDCPRPREGGVCGTCQDVGRVPIDPYSPTHIASRLALIHCEISEAVECVARGGMELYWIEPKGPKGADVVTDDATRLARGWKPEGFPIELADVFLRLCDFAESLGLVLRDQLYRYNRPRQQTAEKSAARLCYLHDLLLRADCADFCLKKEQLRADLNQFCAELFDVAHEHNVDLLAMAEIKHEYNRTRPIRHGGKLL